MTAGWQNVRNGLAASQRPTPRRTFYRGFGYAAVIVAALWLVIAAIARSLL